MTEIDEELAELQIGIAACRLCKGVGRNMAMGHLPRGLWPDFRRERSGTQVFIIGQNPGRPAPKERGLYPRSEWKNPGSPSSLMEAPPHDRLLAPRSSQGFGA